MTFSCFSVDYHGKTKQSHWQFTTDYLLSVFAATAIKYVLETLNIIVLNIFPRISPVTDLTSLSAFLFRFHKVKRFWKSGNHPVAWDSRKWIPNHPTSSFWNIIHQWIIKNSIMTLSLFILSHPGCLGYFYRALHFSNVISLSSPPSEPPLKHKSTPDLRAPQSATIPPSRRLRQSDPNNLATLSLTLHWFANWLPC